jgi:phosphoglycerate dehydrogenase-like enzyme
MMTKKLFFAPWWNGLREELWTNVAEAHAQRARYDVGFNPHRELPPTEVWQDMLADAEVIITSWGVPSLTEELLAKNKTLKMVAHAAGSVANVASEALWERGVRVLTMNSFMARQVAEWSLMMTLNGARALNRSASVFGRVSMSWQNKVAGKALQECAIGIVGYGDIARHLIGMLQALGVAKILVHSDYLSDALAAETGLAKVDLDTVFAQSDVIHLLDSLTEKTTGMVGRAQLDRIQDGACLINAGRARLIEQNALHASLAQNRYMAAFDVFYEEPLQDDNPLCSLPNVLMTPHIAGQPGRSCYVPQLLEEIDRFYAGEPLRFEVDQERVRSMTNAKLV